MFNNEAKFSLWCDFLERDFIDTQFQTLIADGIINGATSNPSIFKNAFTTSPAYVSAKEKFKKKEPKELYEILATQDIRGAAERLLKNYVDGDDGFVSIEVDPSLSDKAEATFKEGKRLYSTIGMPNVMIKIPATPNGFEAMSELMKKGINVNATLVFSKEQTQKCLDAFEDGSRAFIKRFPKANRPKAVISVFVSRFDRALDELMKKAGLATSKVGIYNAMRCYNLVCERSLENVRTLFASTGVKGDELAKEYYVSELLLPNTINTAPLDTINAFIKSSYEVKKPLSDSEIELFFADMKKFDIDINRCCKKLLNQGLEQFEEAFDDILKSLKG